MMCFNVFSQDRLYKNKAILNVVEPAMNYAQLPKLVSVLQVSCREIFLQLYWLFLLQFYNY